MIIRRICNLHPDIINVSENIHVRSIIDRFLEHTQVYYFANEDEPIVYYASTDMMKRNLFQQIKTYFPVENKNLRERIIDDLHTYLDDNTQAWLLQSDGTYLRKIGQDDTLVSAQNNILENLAGHK